MHNYIANTNPNLSVIRLAVDGSVTLVPILYWIDVLHQRIPLDLTRMTVQFGRLLDADFAIHDASDGRVYLRDGSVFETLDAFKEAN